MGVHGLWKLLEAAGKPVPLETLENKVLAVDVSIWLHQMMKGYQDSRGAPVPNAHLLGLFHRVCKLLYYRIKPVFVFDGGVPLLKKQTIAARKNIIKQASQSAAEAREKLLRNLVRRKAVRQILHGSKIPDEIRDDKTAPEDMFELPPIPQEIDKSISSDDESHAQLYMETSESSESEPETKPTSHQLYGFKLDLHTLDVKSEEFLSLPPDVRHDILSELKETRKQNSWGRLHEMPEESGEFSNYQLGRLIKRRNVQVSLEQAEKEMGGKVLRINELQDLMTAQGVSIIEESSFIESASQRIASDSSTRYVLCKESTSEPQSSQSIQASTSRAAKMEEEQAEFIAKMAENMLQQISKKRQDISINKKKESLQTVKEEEEENVSDYISPGPSGISSASVSNKVLADSWSSDEDDVICEADGDRSQNFKSAYASPSEEPKSGADDSSNSDVPNKDLPKLDACSENANIPQDNIGTTFRKESDSEKKLNKEPEIVVSDETNEDLVAVSAIEREGSISPCSEALAFGQFETKSSQPTTFLDKKKSLEITIHPGEKPDDNDDIFADIFQDNINVHSDSKQIKLSLSEGKEKENISNMTFKSFQEDIGFGAKESIQKIIRQSEKPDDDDIFADIFEKSAPKQVSEPYKKEEHLKHGLEIQKHVEKKDVNEFSKTPIQDEDFSADESNNQIASPGDENVAEEEPNPILSSLFSKPLSSSSEWNEMEASLEAEQIDLQKERGRQERLAASITDQMCVEAQELLQLFGLPFIVAPMEAEAQCAFLDAISLTEGSITDDSDIWLFGGRKVYKNFFNQKKHVLQFTSSNINHYFKLSREQLVQLALLVGSDYTTGIQGVGPVTALEIVAAFHSRMELDPVQCALKGLSHFKDWWNSGRPHKSNRIRLLDKKLKNVKFSEGFPSQAVIEAYLRPSVDDSSETFSWGSLDLPALREYARSKFGWTASKTDEILLPVSKKWNARSSQRAIDSYFNLQPHLVEGLNKMSKRVQTAVSSLGANETDSEAVDDPDPEPIASQKQKKLAKKRSSATVDKQVKRKRNKDNDSTDPASGVEEHRVKPTIEHEADIEKRCKEKELPVRAPTVPRERSSTGVKRVGVQSVEIVGRSSNFSVKAIVDPQTECTSKPASKRVKKRESSDVTSRKSTDKRVFRASPLERDISESNNDLMQSNLEFVDATPSGSGTVKNSTSQTASADVQSDSDDDGSKNVSAELAALKEVSWENDPWGSDNFDGGSSREPRKPKVYFGGVRPNRPKKPVRSQPIIPVRANDSRGVQPGWLTEERLQSRSTAWVDAVHTKKEESIPQRERDHRARDEAKMKAISLVKAAEAKQASRLLGVSPRRGRRRVKPTRKVLPEHNLSESSSDE